MRAVGTPRLSRAAPTEQMFLMLYTTKSQLLWSFSGDSLALKCPPKI